MREWRPARILLVAVLGVAACDITAPDPPSSHPREFVAVAAGDEHTCATSAAGDTYCWGRPDFSRLGYQPHGELCDAVGCIAPIPIDGSLPFQSLTAGESHNCGLIDKQAYCWGFGRFGQLGDDGHVLRDCLAEPAFPCTNDPFAVAVGYPLENITAARMHTCALTSGNLAVCWGWNIAGQLGRGFKDVEPHFTPRLVGGGILFSHLSTGFGHTCAVSVDAEGYCWGAGAQGRLGNGDEEERFTPTPVAGGLSFRMISAGGSFTCGVTTAGEVYCWGHGLAGRLGTGDGRDRLVPTRTLVPEPVSSVATGHSHACAITGSGTLYCWGNNDSYQIGVGDRVHRTVPAAVPLAGAAVQVTAGYHHTCAITEDQRLWCWGGNYRYQLGDGTVHSRSEPTQINP